MPLLQASAVAAQQKQVFGKHPRNSDTDKVGKSAKWDFSPATKLFDVRTDSRSTINVSRHIPAPTHSCHLGEALQHWQGTRWPHVCTN